jgi:hypothetical protein
MKHSAALALTILVLASTLAVTAQTALGASERFTNTKYGYSITPPEGYQVSSGTSTSSKVVFFSSQKDSEIDVFGEEVTGSLDDLTGSELQDLGTLENFHLLAKNVKQLDGLDYTELVYLYKQGGMDLECKSCIFVANQTEVIVAFGAKLSSYQDDLPVFESSFQTLKINTAAANTEAQPLPLLSIAVACVVVAAVVVGVVVVVKRRNA